MIAERWISNKTGLAYETARFPGARVLVWVFDEGRKNAYDQVVEIAEYVCSDNGFFYARIIPAQEVFAFQWGKRRLFYFITEER